MTSPKKITKNMKYWLRRLPCGISEIPFSERLKLELAKLAYVSSAYEYSCTVELTDAGSKWILDNSLSKNV